MKKKLFLLILFLSYKFFAQQYLLKGIVKDSLSNPLEYVNIIAEHQKELKSFGFTDTNGTYKLTLEDSLTYDITVTHIGFSPIKFKFHPKKLVTKKNFTLKEQGVLLQEVEIKSPVIVKEDTIFYDTQKFTNGKEYKLKSIVKKLPGLEVNRNGEVKFNGRTLSKVYVDGKLFFNGSTKLAVENIPADAVKDIKIIDNHNDVGFLKKHNDSEEIVMDVSLKEDKKKFFFGDVEVGKGNDDFYKLHNTGFYHSPKTSINAIFKINNIGEKTFTIKDYVDFHADKNSVFKGEFDFKMTGFEDFTENTNLLASVRRFGAGNLMQEINPKLYFSAYTIYSDNTSEMFNLTSNKYPSFIETKERSIKNDKSLILGNLFLEYKRSDKEVLKFRVNFDKSKKGEQEYINSEINTITNALNINRNITKNFINPKIEWHNEHTEKIIFSGIADYKFNEHHKPNFYESSSLSFFENLVPLNLMISPNLFEESNTRKHYFITSLKAFITLKPRNQLHLGISNLYKDELFITDAHQQSSNFQNIFSNNIDYVFHSFLASAFYRLKKGKIRLTTGVKLKRNHWTITQKAVIDKTKWNLFPELKFKYRFHGKKELQLNYKMANNFSDIENLTNQLRFKSYNTLFKGNPNLEDELYHKINLRYSLFNYYKGHHFIKMSYRKAVSAYVSPIQFNNFTNFLTIEELANPMSSFSANVNLSRRIKQLNFYLNTKYSNTDTKQLFNNAITKTNNESYSYQFKVKTLFKKFPLIELAYKQSINRYKFSEQTSKFTRNELSAIIEYDFLKSFKFDLDYKLYQTKNFSESTYQLLNTSLAYHKDDSPWMFKLYGNNLLNYEFKQSNDFTQYLISDTKQFLMPRVVMCIVGYKF